MDLHDDDRYDVMIAFACRSTSIFCHRLLLATTIVCGDLVSGSLFFVFLILVDFIFSFFFCFGLV